jgi:hypothetical protein
LVALLAEVVAEKQFVVAGALGAVGASARRGDKLRVALVEGRIFQDEQNIRLNPELQIAHGQKNPRRILAAVVGFLEASRECLCCWSVGSFASSSAWPTPISLA